MADEPKDPGLDIVTPVRWTKRPTDICVRCFERLDPKGKVPHECYPEAAGL